MHDLVEWAAAQPWSDGNVGMIGISYFATTQVEAAVEHPEHLKAIFPIGLSPDLYEADEPPRPVQLVVHHPVRLDDRDDVAPRRRAVARPPAQRGASRPQPAAAAREVRDDERRGVDRHPPRGDEAAPRPAPVGRHLAVDSRSSTRSTTSSGRPRNVLPDLADVDIPVYLGCDWQNVPLHLPGTFTALAALAEQPERARRADGRVRADLAVGEPPRRGAGLVRPLAQGPRHRDHGRPADPLRPARRGADGDWRSAEQWPPAGVTHQEWALRADGRLDVDEGDARTSLLHDARRRPRPGPSRARPTRRPC